MSDVTIPEAVLKRADEAEARFMGTSVEVIAQAILAETERCANIADRHPGPVSPFINPQVERVSRAIAQAIRSSHD